jgi:hypothetical protein
LRKAYQGQTLRETGTVPPISSDGELLRRGLAAQLEREPHSIGDPDPDRKRKLGEVEIDLGTGPRRIRVAHDPQAGTMSLHGVHLRLADLDPGLARSFEATAAAVNEAQGTAEMEDQLILLGALLDRILRRHKFAADAVVRQLDHERFAAI